MAKFETSFWRKVETKLRPKRLLLPLVVGLGGMALAFGLSVDEDEVSQTKSMGAKTAIERMKEEGFIRILPPPHVCPVGDEKALDNTVAVVIDARSETSLSRYKVKIEEIYTGGRSRVYCGTDLSAVDGLPFDGVAIFSAGPQIRVGVGSETSMKGES